MTTQSTARLLQQVELFNKIKATGLCASRPLTQAGLDWLNGELSAIEAELDRRQPEGEFITLYQQIYNPLTGECWTCGADTLWGDAPHNEHCTAQEGQPIGFEREFCLIA